MDAARRRVTAAAIVAGCTMCLALVCGSGVARAEATVLTKAQIGIADQKHDSFNDARLRALGLGFARRAVAWDALNDRYQRREIQAWLHTTRLAGMEPLITFARSRSKRKRDRQTPPTARAYRRHFRRFHKRFPEVTTYSAWNEPNHCGTGTCRRPRLVAQYYKIIRRGCETCTVLAADLNDHPDPVPWARKFRAALGYEPARWGYHNYIDANRRRTTLTRRLLRAVKGHVWLTEVGGLVARRNDSKQRIPQGKARAAKVTRFILERLALISPRIRRVYIYHWSSETRRDSWDSAFIAHDGTARPSLRVFQDIVADLPPGPN